MRYTGKIKEINHIVVSDPNYNENVWCRYEAKDLDLKEYNIDINIFDSEFEYEDSNHKFLDFKLLLHKNDDCIITKKGMLVYKEAIDIKKYEIGIDSACIALGINESAEEIINAKEEWQPPCALVTGTDGYFGGVVEGRDDNALSFILIDGYFYPEFMKEEELIDYFKSQFDIQDLSVIKESEYEL